MEQWLNHIVSKIDALKEVLIFDTAALSEPEMVFRICLQLLLLAGSGFFSSSETALFALSRLDLQQLRRERNPQSETIHELLDQPRRLIISILSGNELVNIAAAANMTVILVNLYGAEHAGWINLLVMIPLLLLFGEVTPKTIAVANPVRYSTKIVASPMNMWVRFVAPLRYVIRGIADRITTLIVGEEKTAENILQIDEFKTLVEQVAEEGELDATERALIHNLLEANDTEIVEIMTPRTQTMFLDANMSVSEMIESFKSYRHPRVPVFRDHRDNLVGFVHAEDVLNVVLSNKDLGELKPEDIMHPAVVVPLTKRVDEIFDFFKEQRVRAAVCLNEFGGVEGIVTMRDVLNFIFGQISEDVKGEELYRERDDNSYIVPGDMKLTDFNNLTNFGLEDPRMTTIGGVAFRLLDRLPQVNDQVVMEGISITVMEMDNHRIAKVQVSQYASSHEEFREAEDTGENEDTAENEDPGENKKNVPSANPGPAREEKTEPADAVIEEQIKPDETPAETTAGDGEPEPESEIKDRTT